MRTAYDGSRPGPGGRLRCFLRESTRALLRGEDPAWGDLESVFCTKRITGGKGKQKYV